jgi:phosphoribosylformimino-5-aminoimidazole carboxamide ribotide isomerase
MIRRPLRSSSRRPEPDGFTWSTLTPPVRVNIAAAVAGRAQVQTGGGVRSEAAAAALADLGVARVIIGTAAMEDPALVARIAARQPAAVGLDGRSGEVAVRGWMKGAGATVLDVLPRFEDAGVAAVIITEITRDGTLAGPDLHGLRAALERTTIPVIASGGVGTLADVEALAIMRANGRVLGGVITGKALYEHRFTVAEALKVLA